MGGAPQLLLTFLLKLDMTAYDPVVWCIRRSSASELFEQHGFKVVINEKAIPFLHISDGFYGVRHPHLVGKMLFGQIRSYFTARKIFSEIQPDIIHLNSSVLPGILCAASRYPGRVIVNILECLHPGYTGFRRWLVKTLTRKWGDFFVFMLPSEAERWDLHNEPNTIVVFDFIDIDAFAHSGELSELRDEYGVGRDMPLIGYFGRFTPSKGIHLLLRALGKLRAQNVSFHAVLVGPEVTEIRSRRFKRQSTLKEIIAEEHLEKHVTFTGERLAVEKLVAQCDILAIPFTEPHFSRLCGEAAAAGRPAVAFAIDGPGEEIIDGQTGLLVKPFDIDDLAEKLTYLCEKPDERLRMGTAASRLGKTVFNGDRNVEQVFSLYTLPAR
jgi:glycosyltransferase involved in cell wall biosynthesis